MVWPVAILVFSVFVAQDLIRLRDPLGLTPRPPDATLGQGSQVTVGGLGSYCWDARDMPFVKRALAGFVGAACVDGPGREPEPVTVTGSGSVLFSIVGYRKPEELSAALLRSWDAMDAQPVAAEISPSGLIDLDLDPGD